MSYFREGIEARVLCIATPSQGRYVGRAVDDHPGRLRWKGVFMSRPFRSLVPGALCALLALVFAPSVALAQAPRESSLSASNSAFSVSFLPSGTGEAAFAADSAPPPPAVQSSHGGGVGIGVKGGWLFSSLASDNINVNHRQGLIGGLWFGGNRDGVVGVMGELLYARKNGGTALNGQNVDLYYLEIPVLMRINVGAPTANGGRFYLLAGPSFDVLLKGRQEDLDVKNNYSSVDVGLKFGAGFEIVRLLIEGQYNMGLTNILSANNPLSADSAHSRTFSIMAGFRFN